MAPQGPGAGTTSLELSLWCLAVLLMITITLLSLCTKCGRHTFQHQENSEKVQTPSQLIKLSPIEGTTGGKDNLWHTNINIDQKGDPGLTPVPENSSLQSATQPGGDLWFTPWRSHSGVPIYGKGELSATSNERLTLKTGGDISKDETGSTALERELTTETPVSPVSEKSPHMQTVLGGAFPEDNSEDRDYQTIEELNCHSSQRNHVAGGRCREDPAVIAPSPLEGKAEYLNGIYARISKKIKTSKAPIQLPPDEEVESAPPVPDKCFDMEEYT